MRFLTVLAAILLSCGIANAQTVKGDVNNDGKLNTLDVTAAADSIMDDKKSGLADVNKDQKVDAADVVTVVKLIQETDYFYLGTEEPTSKNYTTLEGVTTEYESLEDVLKAGLKLPLEYNERGYLLCPSSWRANNLVLQNENNGEFLELKLKVSVLTPGEVNDFSDYNIFETDEDEGGYTTVLKRKVDAEEYKRSLNPEYFWLGNTMPTKNNFPTLGGVEVPGVVTTYTSLPEAMGNASRNYSKDEWAVVLYPYHWGTIESLIKDAQLVFLDSANKTYYETKQKSLPDFPDYLYYESAYKIGANTTITLSTKADAEEKGATKYVYVAPVVPDPTPVTPVNPDPTPVTPVNPDPAPVNPDPVVVPGQAVYTGGNGIRFVITNNCGVEARLSGGLVLNLSKHPGDWANSTQAYAHMHAPTVGSSYAYNDIIIPPGGKYTSPEITSITGIYQPGTNFTDGSWYFMNSDNGPYGHSIFLYSRIYSRSRNSTSGSNHMYVVYPLQNTKLLRGYTYYLNLYWKNPDASLWPDMSGSKYIILGYGKTGL